MNKTDKRLLAVLDSRVALLDGWKCPVCKAAFKDAYGGCAHVWDDVRACNEKFLLCYLKGNGVV